MREHSIFVDTGAWFALQVTDDTHHTKAKTVFPKLLDHYSTLATSNHVMGETYTLLRSAIGFREAWRFIELIRESPRIKTIFAIPEVESEAFDLLHRYSDHDFSFVDAVSFCIMKKEQIHHAFAFDRHFATAGFTRIPLDFSNF